MRTRPDADRLKAYTNPGDHVLIIGGGLLGLELAASLREIGMRVTIIQRIARLMDRQLDDVGSRLLHEEMTDRGIDIYYNNEVKYLTGKDRVTGAKLASGETISCQAVVMAVGTTPNVEIAREASLLTNRGVVVNEYLQTADPAIFALGEMAEFNGTLFGITAAAEEQADVLVHYLSGDLSRYYRGSLFMNILKMAGLHLCSLGMVTVPPNEPGYEEVVFMDLSKRYYKKCIIHHDRLVGAILFGDKSEFQEYKELITKGTELSDKRLSLLRAGQSTRAGVIGKLVCSCNNVGEGNLRQAVEGGCRTLPDLCQTTGAGTGCGSCRPEVKAILESAVKKAKAIAEAV
jgi:ferredoxin-nitrate reductase